MKSLIAHMQQVTSVLGSAGFIGIAMSVITGQMTWQTAVPYFVAAVASILIPDNTGAKTAAGNLAVDAVALLQALSIAKAPVGVPVPAPAPATPVAPPPAPPAPVAPVLSADAQAVVQALGALKQHLVATSAATMAPPVVASPDMSGVVSQ